MILFKIILKKSYLLFFIAYAWAVNGVPLVNFNYQFTTPFIFIASDDLNSTVKDSPLYSDKIFSQITFPFYLGMNLGYILELDKQHFLMGNWNLRYNDDPINFFGDASVSSKLPTPSFTSRSIINALLIKYIWKEALPFLEYSPSLGTVFSLTENGGFEFKNNIYNFYSFSSLHSFKFHKLHQYHKNLNGMIFNLDLQYIYYYYPNGDSEERIASDNSIYPSTKRDFHNFSTKFKYNYYFHQAMAFSLQYKLGIDFYVKQPIHNGDINNPQFLDENERNYNHSLQLGLLSKFLEHPGYHAIELAFSYLFNYFDSNYVELLTFTSSEAGDRIGQLSQAQLVGSTYVFYEKDYKDYMTHIGSIYSKFNITPQHQITTGYSIKAKYFFNVHGKYGNDNTYGAFKNEKRLDMSHIVTLGYIWKSESKKQTINPFLGALFSSSTDQTLNYNRHIFFIGLRGTYEI